MKVNVRPLTLVCALALTTACGDDTTETPDANVIVDAVAMNPDAGVAPDTGSAIDAGDTADSGMETGDAGEETAVTLAVTNGADSPFAAEGVGGLAFTEDGIALAATETGIRAYTTTGTMASTPNGYMEWTLTSTGMGAAATAIVVPAANGAPADRAFFFGAGTGQVGVIAIDDNGMQGNLLTESALAAPLDGVFPSALAAPTEGTAADALWVVDAPLSAGIVRAYPYAMYAEPNLTEDTARAFTPAAVDFNTDGNDDLPILGAIAFSDDGAVGLVGFTVSFPGVTGVAGGVFAFDTSNGAELGRIVVPSVDTATTTSAFVGAIVVDGDTIYIGQNEFDQNFAGLGGYVNGYNVESWNPFSVTDEDANADYDQPSGRVTLPLGVPAGLTPFEGSVLIVDSPFFAPSAVQVLGPDGMLGPSLSIGTPFAAGNNAVGGIVVSPTEDFGLISSESGLLRVDISQ